MSASRDTERATTREPWWMCSTCGHMFDAVTNIEGFEKPSEDDISICIKCGALYTRHAGAWVPTTADEYDNFDDDYKKYLSELKRRQKIVMEMDQAGATGPKLAIYKH